MSTTIGSEETNIYMEQGLFRVKVGGYTALEVLDPGESGGFATREYVDGQTINDLQSQEGNYSANNHRITNLAAPTDLGDMATKQYTDEAAQISLGIANNTIITSELTANSTELTIGTTNLNMNGQRITGLATATDGADLLSRATGDSRYYQSTTPLNSITTPSANLSLNSQKVTNMATPTSNADCASKQYADQAVAGVRADQITNQTNADSKLTANQTEVTIGSVPLNMNSQKITGLADAAADSDCINRITADSRYQQKVAMNLLTAPAANVSLNSHKITLLADATTATDCLNRQTGDSRYYLATDALDLIAAATDSVDVNSQGIINLADPVSSSDMSNKKYIDDEAAAHDNVARHIVSGLNSDSKLTANNTELTNNLTPLNMNSQKVTGLANATADTDLLNRQTADTRYYANTTTLDSITPPTASVSLNSHKLTSVADATTAGDLLSRQYADSRYYSNTASLDLLTQPSGDLDLNNFKLTNLSNPNTNSGALNRQTADSRYYSNSTTLDAIANATQNVSFGNQTIVDLAAPTVNTDLVTRGYITTNMYSNATTLDSITAPNASVSLNSQKITNLAAPALNTDLASLGYCTSNIYTNTTALNAITAPDSDLSMNNHKITSLQAGVSSGDGMAYDQLQSIVSGLGYKRIKSSVVLIGNAPPAGSITIVSGIVTSATWNNVSQTTTITLDHPAIGYTYQVLVRMYATRANTDDNDTNMHNVWVQPVSSTQTVIVTQYNTSGVAESIGYNIDWIESD